MSPLAHANIIVAIRERNSKCQNTQKVIGIIKIRKSQIWNNYSLFQRRPVFHHYFLPWNSWLLCFVLLLLSCTVEIAPSIHSTSPPWLGFLARQFGLTRHVILPYSVALKHYCNRFSCCIVAYPLSPLSSPLFLFTYITSYVSAI